ncbi:transcriptional regulator [Shewanella waksmanii]|uniref:winged helix-turn-helix domain-containing protein n=1 Tax=Shewanella waksmanii TaxID=213783 RepID=UPI0037365C0E
MSEPTINNRKIVLNKKLVSFGKNQIKLGGYDWHVLMILIENHGKIVSSDILVSTAWEGKIVTKASLTQSISNIRAALGDDGKNQRYLKTIAKAGYTIPSNAISYGKSRRLNLQHSFIYKFPLIILSFIFGIALERPIFDSIHFLNNREKIKIYNEEPFKKDELVISASFLNENLNVKPNTPRNLNLLKDIANNVYIDASDKNYNFIFTSKNFPPINISANSTPDITRAFESAIDSYAKHINNEY